MKTEPMNGNRNNKWKQDKRMETGPMNGNRNNEWKQNQWNESRIN